VSIDVKALFLIVGYVSGSTYIVQFVEWI
jgi:hypothetical protein